ncbi:MAG: cobalamin-binding protein [Anaerolineales bacterium]|nr:cobalamin-binding protein [Anaerolineales bacterium]
MLRKFFALTLLIALLAACAPQATAAVAPAATEVPATQAATAIPTAEAAGIVFTDGLGHEVKLEGPAQRVVSLAPSITEFLFAVGAGSQTVGRDEMSNFPEEALNVASIGSTYGDLNAEAILALKPDLVIAAQANTPEQVKALENLGVTVYYLNNPVTFAELFEQVELFGQLTGHEEEASALAESLSVRVDGFTSATANFVEKPKVFYEIDGTDASKPWTTGAGTFIDTIIAMAGGVNIGGVLNEPYAQISVEEIVLQNPDFILLGDAAYGVTAESVAARPGWGDLTAVKSGAIVPFDDNLASRPGPRLVDGLEEMLKILHPELVPAQ